MKPAFQVDMKSTKEVVWNNRKFFKKHSIQKIERRVQQNFGNHLVSQNTVYAEIVLTRCSSLRRTQKNKKKNSCSSVLDTVFDHITWVMWCESWVMSSHESWVMSWVMTHQSWVHITSSGRTCSKRVNLRPRCHRFCHRQTLSAGLYLQNRPCAQRPSELKITKIILNYRKWNVTND